MNDQSQTSCAVGCLIPVAGAAAGVESTKLAEGARSYCRSYHVEHYPVWDYVWELPVAMLAGSLIAVTAYGITHLVLLRFASIGRRMAIGAVAAVIALALMTWGHFAWLGTPTAEPGRSGLCPVGTNIPDWWPAWIPA
jgi:hypothetical protein